MISANAINTQLSLVNEFQYWSTFLKHMLLDASLFMCPLILFNNLDLIKQPNYEFLLQMINNKLTHGIPLNS